MKSFLRILFIGLGAWFLYGLAQTHITAQYPLIIGLLVIVSAFYAFGSKGKR